MILAVRKENPAKNRQTFREYRNENTARKNVIQQECEMKMAKKSENIDKEIVLKRIQQER